MTFKCINESNKVNDKHYYKGVMEEEKKFIYMIETRKFSMFKPNEKNDIHNKLKDYKILKFKMKLLYINNLLKKKIKIP